MNKSTAVFTLLCGMFTAAFSSWQLIYYPSPNTDVWVFTLAYGCFTIGASVVLLLKVNN